MTVRPATVLGDPVTDAPVIPGAEPWSSPGEGSNARTGVVVSHGFTGNPTSVRPLARRIADEGYAVEVPRLPGHGTRWQDLARTRWADWRGEIERVTDDLAARCDEVVLVGLSLGGALCLDVALTHDAVRAVATINAPLLDRPDPIARLAPVLQYLIPVVPAAVAGIKNDVAKPGVEETAYSMVPAKAGYSLTVGVADVRERLVDLEKPVLGIYSALDQTVPNASTKALPELAPNADVHVVELPRSMHVATLDWDADLLETSVLGLLSRD